MTQIDFIITNLILNLLSFYLIWGYSRLEMRTLPYQHIQLNTIKETFFVYQRQPHIIITLILIGFTLLLQSHIFLFIGGSLLVWAGFSFIPKPQLPQLPYWWVNVLAVLISVPLIQAGLWILPVIALIEWWWNKNEWITTLLLMNIGVWCLLWVSAV